MIVFNCRGTILIFVIYFRIKTVRTLECPEATKHLKSKIASTTIEAVKKDVDKYETNLNISKNSSNSLRYDRDSTNRRHSRKEHRSRSRHRVLSASKSEFINTKRKEYARTQNTSRRYSSERHFNSERSTSRKRSLERHSRSRASTDSRNHSTQSKTIKNETKEVVTNELRNDSQKTIADSSVKIPENKSNH